MFKNENNSPKDIFGIPKSTSETNHPKKGADPAGQFLNELIHYTVLIYFWGLSAYFRQFFTRLFYIPITLALSAWSLSTYLSQKNVVLELIHELHPEFFNWQRLGNWFFRFSELEHTIFFFVIIMSIIFITYGVLAQFKGDKYQKMFSELGIMTLKTRRTPKFLSKKDLGNGIIKLKFRGKGIKIEDVKNQVSGIESYLDTEVIKVKRLDKPSLFEIITTKNRIPEVITYDEAEKISKNKPYQFYIGQSKTEKGFIKQDISNLPHVMIAGSTGVGKSNFFKSSILSLLENSSVGINSSNPMHMYLIDLKGGLEFIHFAEQPNVKVVISINESVQVLQHLVKEMEDRFEYLRKNRYEHIVPKRDELDRIILAVDEFSDLFAKPTKDNPNYKLFMEARRLIDALSRKARAAGINIMLATQKVEKAVLPTSVSENITGRMALRSNSVASSTNILGNKRATQIDAIQGRGIWNVGIEENEVQVPYLDKEILISRCERMQQEFKDKKRSFFGPVLDVKEMKESQEQSYFLTKNDEDN